MPKLEITTCPHCKGEFEIETSSRVCAGAILNDPETSVGCPLCKEAIDKDYFKHCQYRYRYEPEPRLNFPEWANLKWENFRNWFQKFLP